MASLIPTRPTLHEEVEEEFSNIHSLREPTQCIGDSDMNRTATKLRQQQLSLARKLTTAELGRTDVNPIDLLRDGLLLADLTLELDRKLSTGTPFPTAWLLPSRLSDPPEPVPRHS